MSTTALYKALIEAHVSEDTAERAVEGLAYTREVATKTDLVELKNRIKATLIYCHIIVYNTTHHYQRNNVMQQTLSENGFEKFRKKIRKKKFPEEMGTLLP